MKVVDMTELHKKDEISKHNQTRKITKFNIEHVKTHVIMPMKRSNKILPIAHSFDQTVTYTGSKPKVYLYK